MKGSEAIINKIIRDAQKIANSTYEEGVAKAQEIINIAESDAKIYRLRNREESSKEREDILRRRITVANLEVKKLLLGAKQELIGKAFEQSIEAIKEDKAAYKKMLMGMLEYATNGDILTVSKNDEGIFTKKFIDDFAKAKGIKLSLSEEYGNFAGGIILSNKSSDKNFTLEVELASLRDEIEPDIAKKLFGDN